MAYSLSFGSGGSPSSGRNVTGATVIRSDNAFVWPTSGNTNLAGSSGLATVVNGGIDLNGSRSGDIAGYYASYNSGNGYGDIVMTSGGGTVYLTGYIGNGLTMYTNLPNSWDGGFQGTFYWYTVPTAPATITATRSGRDVTVNSSNPASDGGSNLTSFGIQYRSSTDGGSTWSSWGNTQTTGGGYTYTGLTPGVTYQFRNYANNAAGSSAATVSANVLIPAGGRRFDGANFNALTVAQRHDGSSFVPLTVAKRYDGTNWNNLT